MKKYFSIGETSRIVNMTSETLRHYDRIGLMKPSKTDEWTNYRYYTEQDIVKLNTIHALQQMDLSLKEIIKILELDSLEKIISMLDSAERKADKKISELLHSKSVIQSAKSAYRAKLISQSNTPKFYIREFPERVIMLSDTMKEATLDNLWNYLSHFYNALEPELRDLFAFEDLAGIYLENNSSNMFAVCTSYTDIKGLKILPRGNYLCADCTEENRMQILNDIIKEASARYNVVPKFTLQIIVISGILQWNYQIQIYLGKDYNVEQ